jgi:hypothetical protein
LGDVVGDGEGPVGAGTLGVHPPFGDDFAIEVGEFFQEPDILQQLRAAWPGGHHVLVVATGQPALVTYPANWGGGDAATASETDFGESG